MFSKPGSCRPFFLSLGLSLLVILILVTRVVTADKAAPLTPQKEAVNSPSGWGDDGIFEVGVEWMNVFPNPADNRNYYNVSCDGAYTWLQLAGWTPRFRWANYDAYEKDFKSSTLGGWEDAYGDTVDLAMICTHGGLEWDATYQKTLSSVVFGSDMDDQDLLPSEAYMAFGDNDLEYLALDACHILDDNSLIYWASTFNGLHMLFSFANNMHPDPYGDGFLWGYFMAGPYPTTLTQAWFSAIDINQPSTVCARIVGESLSNYNEYWWNTWPDPVVDDEKWIWEHCSHGYIYGLNNQTQPEVISLPVLRVQHRVVNENYVTDTIAPAFGMSGQVQRDDLFYRLVDSSGGITQTLLVDAQNGSFNYHNWSRLWTTPVITPTLPSYRVADILIDDWFDLTPAKGLPGAWYRTPDLYIYDYEEIYNLLLSRVENGDLQGQVTAQIPTDLSMTYPRLITVGAGTINGLQQVDYPILGPGARMVIYLGDGGEIIGAQGGSRDVEIMTDTVDILESGLVWSMYLADPGIAIGELPFAADTITHTVPTLGYYEMPYYVLQDELIPVWEFRGNFYQGGSLVAEDYPVYLPAANEYMPPKVEIIKPVDGSTFWLGSPISFVGSVSGGMPPYTYQWTSSSDGYMGNELSIVTSLGSEIKTGIVFQPAVSLQVTDANGLTSTGTITLNIKPVFWIPLVMK